MKKGFLKTLSAALVLMLALAPSALAEDYTATAQGFGGEVSVTLTIEDGHITSATAVGASETEGIGSMAIEQLPGKMMEANSVSVDAIAGATVSSTAVLAAAADALTQSGMTLVAVEAPAEEVAPTVLPFADPDVIIVGAGSSGMNAAIAAAEAGAKVYLVEKNSATGGSIRYAGGTTSAAGTKMQIAAGLEDSPENFAADIERMGGGTNVKELTQKHTENATAAVDWLDSLGVDFGDRIPQMSASYDAFNVARECRVAGGGKAIAAAVEGVLAGYVEKGQVALLLDAEVADIIVEDGAVKGVIMNDEAKTEYRAPATVLATGGYGHNEDLIHRYNFANVLTMSPAFVTGDGYRFAEKAGALFNNMDYLPAYPGGVPVGGFDVECTAVVNEYPNVLWVNQKGERIVSEFGSLDSERKAAYAGAPENLVYIVFNQAVKDAQDPILKVGGGFSGKPDENWVYFDQLMNDKNCVFTGATLEELAANAGLDAVGLAKTIETYNGYVDAGTDKDFGRDVATMSRVDAGPFYAIKTCPYVMLTKGGPLMNTDAQVLNQNHEPIVGLYECGELAGGANIGGSANIGGLANTSTIVWGKIAGESAAAFALAQ
ncbi:MAG: FAD-dependent oxidoreductase [Clostridia bacterium]